MRSPIDSLRPVVARLLVHRSTGAEVARFGTSPEATRTALAASQVAEKIAPGRFALRPVFG